LLIQPRAEDGESWPGYLLRIAEQNHMTHALESFAQRLGIIPQALVASQPEVVMGTLGIRHFEQTHGVLTRSGSGRNLMRESGRTFLSRVCPLCLNEMWPRYIKASWERAFEFTCDRHQLLLVDRCPKCGRAISHLRKHFLACDCGVSFLSMPRQKVPKDFASYYKILDLADIYAKPAKTFEASSVLETHAVMFCRRVQSMRESNASVKKQKRPSQFFNVFMSCADFQVIEDIFEQWPQGLHAFLEHHLSSEEKIFVSTFLLTAPLNQKDVLVQIKSGVREWSKRHRGLRLPGTKTPQVVQSNSQGTVGIRHLMDSTGCSYVLARHWIESGRLGQCLITKNTNGIRRYHIDKAMVQKAIQITKSTASVSEMALTLGTSCSVIRSLVNAKVLYGVPYGIAPRSIRVHPSEVFSVANTLLRLARRRRNLINDQLLLPAVVYRFKQRPLRHRQAFFGALLQGKIAINKTKTHVTRLDEILIDSESLREWEKLNLR
jgi:DNA-directed RNA polymerase subunit RPC12/RpoP